MLLRFVFRNILSFRNEVEFNLLPAKSLRTHPGHVISITPRINVLKGSIIYGANGAGKSNLVKAAGILRDMILNGKIPSDYATIRCRMSPPDEKSSIECEFSIKGRVYSYGVTFTDRVCTEEWLYDIGSEKEKPIFTRIHSDESGKSRLNFGKKFESKERNKLLVSLLEENILKKDELIFSHREILKIEEIDNAYEWFSTRLVVMSPERRSTSLLKDLYTRDDYRDLAQKTLSGLDVGIDRIFIKKEPLSEFLAKESNVHGSSLDEIKAAIGENEYGLIETQDLSASISKENGEYFIKRIMTLHHSDGNDYTFDLKEESDGTQKLLEYIPAIKRLKEEDVTYIIDEIDRSLHPNILLDMMRSLMSGPLSGQLICTSHESNLLDCQIFRTDEIWFAEKSRDTGGTSMYPLSDFKPRHDLDICKGYLKGRFGAIPFLAHTEDLKWNTDNAIQKEESL